MQDSSVGPGTSIGAGAQVTRSFTSPSALRLHLGAAERVALS